MIILLQYLTIIHLIRKLRGISPDSSYRPTIVVNVNLFIDSIYIIYKILCAFVQSLCNLQFLTLLPRKQLLESQACGIAAAGCLLVELTSLSNIVRRALLYMHWNI